MKYTHKLTVLIVALVLLSPAVAFASLFEVSSTVQKVQRNDIFEANVFLDTKSEYINAVEGSLTIPRGLMVKEIRFDGSVVPLWIEAPKVTGNIVSFAGVIPGGYKGSPERTKEARGNLFILVLEAKEAGTYTISFTKGTAAYIDDGSGTRDKTTLLSSKITVVQSVGGFSHTTLNEDTLAPEPFTPSVASGEPYGIEGKVLVFSTQDKNTGVDHFEIARSYNRFARESNLSWSTAISPYVLSGADTDKYIFVKATDRKGYFSVGILPPQSFSLLALMYTWGLYVVLGLVVLIVIVIHYMRRKRHR